MAMNNDLSSTSCRRARHPSIEERASRAHARHHG